MKRQELKNLSDAQRIIIRLERLLADDDDRRGFRVLAGAFNHLAFQYDDLAREAIEDYMRGTRDQLHNLRRPVPLDGNDPLPPWAIPEDKD